MTLTEDLCEWVGQQPAWQQDLSRRLLSRSHLDGSEYDEALAVVLAAHGALDDGEEAPTPHGVALQDFPASAHTGETPRLLSFGRTRGVGSLSETGELQFARDGLTVAFGANAAGKSTYVGALKTVCRAVDGNEVLRSNVFAAEPAEQVAMLQTVTGTAEPVGRRVDLRDPEEPQMSSISVFDVSCAELYIDGDNAIAFVPSVLLLLARLVPTQLRMRADVERRQAQAQARMPRFDDIPADTDARRRVDQLRAGTDLDELRRFVTLSDAERERLTAVRAAVAAADADEAEEHANAASRDATQAEELAANVRTLADAIADEKVGALAAVAGEASTSKAAVEAAAAEFAGLSIQGVGDEAWRRMWEAARDFVAATPAPGAFPPPADSPCPLCLQPLSATAADNLAHFESHVHSALSERARTDARALSQALAVLNDQLAARCRGAFLTSLGESDTELASSIDTFLQSAEARMSAMRAAPGSMDVPPLASDPCPQLNAWAAVRRQHAETLMAATQPEEASRLRTELVELDARSNLARRMSDVQAAVAEHARIAGLANAFTDLNTNRVTRCQREFAETAVTSVLEAKLSQEMGALGCGHIPVELRARGAGGETFVGLRLIGAAGSPAVSEILSEGEQRALSLAFFLAEVATAEHDGGILLDDPVSSLDDERRAYIAGRLVEEALQRQVIVFTHDMHLVVDLGDQAKKRDVSVEHQWVWREGNEAGRVDAEPPFTAKNFKARVGALSLRIQEWDNQEPAANQDEALRRARDFYRDMRATWERGVEERLFRGVVQRFQREVKTTSLARVEITDALKRAVDTGMTRCSLFLHDAAEGTLTAIPGRAELSLDFAVLDQFQRDTGPPSRQIRPGRGVS